MHVTASVFSIYTALQGRDWTSTPQIAGQIGVPSENLYYAMRSMVQAGVLEMNDSVRPKHYRINPKPSVTAQEAIQQIERARPIYERTLSTPVD